MVEAVAANDVRMTNWFWVVCVGGCGRVLEASCLSPGSLCPSHTHRTLGCGAVTNLFVHFLQGFLSLF